MTRHDYARERQDQPQVEEHESQRTEALASVWTTGQRPSRTQRTGRYTPESMRHPGKMLPSIAAQVIEAFTRPGELVVDPMCGIGTTLVEAIHRGRDAIGVEYESEFTQLALGNLLLAKKQDATGTVKLCRGDGAAIATLFGDRRGQAALVLTSPPYGASTHGQVRSARDNGGGKIQKAHFRYAPSGSGRGNLAYRGLGELLEGFGRILTGSAELLAPFGVVAVTVRPFRVNGELVDLPGMVAQTAEQAGLVLVDRFAALLAGVRDGGLVNRASFFQLVETRRARERGVPACASAHEDLLVFQRATDLKRGVDDVE
ncbi:TRM11 family SAM-dependent methyltransferase [Spirillospora sp. NPDC127200]